MAATSGRDDTDLNERILKEGFRFDFFQVVRLLERLGEEERDSDGRPLRFGVGQDHAPRQEVVRFRAYQSHAFPAGEIAEIRPPAETSGEYQSPPEMTMAAIGLTGPGGVLPRHYTSLLIARIRNKDFALRDFLDLFNHRTISLFYRAWEKYRFAFCYERTMRSGDSGDEDLFTHLLYCLVGMGTEGLRDRLGFDDEAFLYYAGHFAHQPRSAVSLERIVGDYFELPSRVRQFQGQWLYLDPLDLSVMPDASRPDGRNNRLGSNLVIGARVWNVTSKFRVRLGPLSYAQFRRFIPSGDALGPVSQLVRQYVGGEFDFDVQPVLRGKEVPWCRLGGDPADAARLGWNTWVRSGPFDRDVDDAVFSLEG
jgi:type VI secretion system protein ImpH